MSTLLKIATTFLIVCPADLYKYKRSYIRGSRRLLTELNQENWLPEFISFLRKKVQCIPEWREQSEWNGGMHLNLCF